ncbi:hypothetical protein [Roseovarius nubinhibens]|uniref:hypothetical protein n=1 Tax=Roseovarius nubinhibens TaxID=314263 RepID=UPI0012EA8897|nr:hypothetical protein [Roseovarius nubinhibens]
MSDEFSELDPHQKTILSDDFGMGMSLHVLTEALDLVGFCDGKYFIDRLAPRLPSGVHITATAAKNGPRKSPDFVALDARGRWHVIECKGTQSGPNYCRAQIDRGFAQKRAIEFQGTLKGQSLVTGFDIASAASDTASCLVIVDPKPEDPPLEIGPNDRPLIRDCVARGTIARAMMLAGAPNLSRLMAAPFGDDPRLRADDATTSFRRKRAAQLRENGIDDRKRLTTAGKYLGREMNIELPFEVETAKGSFRQATLRSEILDDVVREFEEETFSDSTEHRDRLARTQQDLAVSRIKTETNDHGGLLTVGKLYRSLIEFR